MKLYKVFRTDSPFYMEYYEAYIVAKTEKEAIGLAKERSEDFKKNPVKCVEVDMTKASIVTLQNTGG